MPTKSDPPEPFPFGRPVRRCKPSATTPRPVFILGAYPSALHACWTPPNGFRRIQAIAVDNEPEPFWNGLDEHDRIEKWKKAVQFDDAWGTVAPVKKLNGSSGLWVDEFILKPLGVSRDKVCISDCLDTYRCSVGLRARIDDTYEKFRRKFDREFDLPSAVLGVHPSEQEIIEEGSTTHKKRLLREIEAVAPDTIVTLGNAAVAVARKLLTFESGADTARLSHVAEKYGAPAKVRLGSKVIELLPLAHPAAPKAYQTAHQAWSAARMQCS